MNYLYLFNELFKKKILKSCYKIIDSIPKDFNVLS